MLNNLILVLLFQLIFTLLICQLSKKLNLLDYPNSRKLHSIPTPYTGGLILSSTFIFIIFITDIHYSEVNYILSYSLLICIAGFLDDKYKLNPGSKLVLQLVPILLILDNNLYLEDIGNYQYFGEIELGSFYKIFTILCILLLINAFNYSDGIDGLLSLLTVNILIFFSIYLSYSNIDFHFLLLIGFPLVIFMFFNFGILKNFKIFLGDSGSNCLGFITGFLCIFLYNIFQIHPSILIWPLAYIVYEFLTVNILRFKNSQGIFIPGRDHLHYELSNIFKLDEKFILVIIIGVNIFFGCLGLFFLKTKFYDYSIITFIILFKLFLLVRFIINKKIKN